jgi:hypothetical protein
MNKEEENKTIRSTHYSFQVLFRKNYARGIHYSQYLEVGDPKVPCLSLTINTLLSAELFGQDVPRTAKLHNIQALYDCVLDENVEDLFARHSFGKELLQWVLEYIQKEFPHVKFLELDDESYIPCNNGPRLDLISYSVAMHCKSWYELHFNAKLVRKEKREKYKDDIRKYGSQEFKKSISWDIFVLYYVTNKTTKQTILDAEEMFKKMYEDSETFPIFFRKLNNTIGRETKCTFFAWWLGDFIKKFVSIEREWVVELEASGHSGGRRRKTRGRRRVSLKLTS